MPELMEKTDSNEKFTAKESKRNVEKGEKKREKSRIMSLKTMD